ncbi:MAG: HEAT repeat domain-containing protein [Gemmataceae bacterium]
MEALGKIGGEDKEVLQALVAALEDKETYVVRAAGRALVRFGPQAKAAIPRLLVLLGHSQVECRIMACLLLGSIRSTDKEIISYLVKISQKDETEYVRLSAYAALAKIDSARLKDTLPRLTAALQSKDENVVEIAAISLILLGRDARDALPKLRTLRDQTSDDTSKKIFDGIIESIQHPKTNPFDD